jgi:hypothetical protein
MMIRNVGKLMLVPAALVLAACSGGDKPPVDDSLKNDLALASQMQAYPQQQFVSPMEQGYGYQPNPYAPQYAPQGYYPQPVYQPAPAPQRVVQQPAAVRRTSTTARTSTAARTSGTTARSSGTVVVQREPEIIRNTKRDAVIGAAAGAVLGAATSRDKVKGAVIGAAAGGVLGGIIGHTVDVKRRY